MKLAGIIIRAIDPYVGPHLIGEVVYNVSRIEGYYSLFGILENGHPIHLHTEEVVLVNENSWLIRFFKERSR